MVKRVFDLLIVTSSVPIWLPIIIITIILSYIFNGLPIFFYKTEEAIKTKK